MQYLGANIYYWGRQEQRRLLLDGLRPWALEARGQGLAERFWFCCFDARGPHVFALFATSAEKQDALRQFLNGRIENFLLAAPSGAALSQEALEQRHAGCRGTTLCAGDREPGLAPNNSFLLFEHETNGYPLWISAGMAAADEFWRQVERLTFWALDRLENRGLEAAALRWLAAVDRALAGHGLPAEAYWRLHAGSLILPLAARLETDEEEVKASLPRVVGERNSAMFSKIWNQPEGGSGQEAMADGLVQLLAAGDGRPLQQRFAALRELNHLLMGQLSQPANLEIPMILYAWQCSLAR